MSKKFYQIDEFFPAAGDERFSLTAESPLDQVTYNIFSADDFTDAAIYEYGERKCLFPETETPLATFHSRFARWKAQRGADIAAAFGALKTAYKPLENYSMVEEHTGTDTTVKAPDNYKETTTHSVSNDYKVTDEEKPTNWKETKDFKVSQDYKESDTQKPTNWKETKDFSVSQDYKETDTQVPDEWKTTNQTAGVENDNASATTNQIIPINGNDYANVNKSKTVETRKVEESISGTFATEHTQEGTRTEETETSGTFATEHTQTGTKTEEISTSGTYAREHTQTGSSSEEKTITGIIEDETTYDTTLTRAGNIGLTTSQQMLLSELDARKRQFVHDVILEFFNLVSVYA